MTYDELRDECLRKQGVSGRKDVGVYLTLPKCRLSRYANRIRLFGRYGPTGELLNELEDGSLVAIFPADGILRSLAAGGVK
jgi:hypothetical protein